MTLYYKSIKDTPVCGHHEVLKLGIWMSDPYLYYISIKDTPVCGHLDFNCLKDIEILAIILVPLIMSLSRGHTGQIKRTVVMR